jgi:MSHA pilin protein MshC
VELVAVVVLMGILAAVAVPRFMARDGAEARGLRDGVAAFLRYAQKLAVGRHGMVYVQSGADGLTLCASAATPCAAGLPGPDGSAPYRVEPSSGLTIAASRGVLGFNARGQPTDAGASPLAAASTYTVTGVAALTVEAETGYVH